MEGTARAIEGLTRRQLIGAAAVIAVVTGVAVATESWWLLLLPFALMMVYWAFVSLDTLILALVALTPLSITLKDEGFNVGLSLPAELMLAGITLFLAFRFIQSGRLPWVALKHPIGIAILIQLAWMFITILTSEHPLISLKAVISRVWFVVPMYFRMVEVLSQPKYRRSLFPLYAYPLAIAAMYTMAVHSQYGFSKETSTWVSFPFYKEHTVYGMALAFMYPYAVLTAFRRNMQPLLRVVAITLALVLTAAIVLSYTRAAWLSVIAAVAYAVTLRLGMSWRQIMSLLVTLGVVLFASQSLWMDMFTKNDTVSSDNFGEHVQSVSNVSTDASNMERINRWKSAYRMFQERPHFGWGLGVYQFEYAPFQHSSDLTIISTNGGDMGNAHSEYIGPLAEMGWPGLLLMLYLVWTIFARGTALYHKLSPGVDKQLVFFALLGLATYFTHGFLNNFLDADEGAVLVWSAAAMIVAVESTAILNKSK